MFCHKSVPLNHSFTLNQLCIDIMFNCWTKHLQHLQCTMLCLFPMDVAWKAPQNNKLLVSGWSIQYFGNGSNSQWVDLVYGGTNWWLNLMLTHNFLKTIDKDLNPLSKFGPRKCIDMLGQMLWMHNSNSNNSLL